MARPKKKVASKSKKAGKTSSKAKAVKSVSKKGAKATKKVVTRAKRTVTREPATAVALAQVAQMVKKARTKSDIYGILAQACGLSKKEIVAVFSNLQELITMDLSKKGPGVFNFPGLMKIVKVIKPATKARKGVNPFTKEPMTYKAKPARSVVKVRTLKGLKEMVL